MIALRHPTTHAPQTWEVAAACDEFRCTGIELQLIDAVDELERAEAAGRPDQEELALRVLALQYELADAV
ncbi:hypothetical protein HC251_22400 [Iamia sp. SCSIO 61187]|uniref:hypothetical protein n=1 Tax=Iamia sp. SCSIO 61187 TaxID=2722752 RepID=UPI001C63B532|nr:hypothetical protein [Iamia sp. SCSIO 61187]QYG94910.1 hypothetical protein HC251_22400 [Iamia sp. SCSIO 61187]